ncbi:F-box LRR [Chlorella sorokiniana]|uniref:F-box LRR n=1 Tax=Chlorella sorokiniana TaxID=3076 RepID=A0A2P6TZD9_CHLSO|nr:F-box LRR [Chlorella sorokiniana]|eukprot:PRW59400.1 F-box LRR [Chlorella sorokiniana]
MRSDPADGQTGPPGLVQLCLQAAIGDEYWRVQRRQLACLPEEAANELLRALVEQRRISPPQLELFRHSATSVHLGGPGITPAWLAALGSFTALHELRLQRCTKLRDAALQQLVSLAPSLRFLDLQGCSGLGDGAVPTLAQLTQLVDLDLAGTGLGAAAVASLVPALIQLTALDLSDLPVDDACCTALAQLLQLRRLRLASTAVGDSGMGALEALPALASLDVSFTEVHAPPALTTLRQLSMVHCALGAVDDSPQEAVWLQIGCTLPHLEELELASTTLQPPNGDRLLRQLVAGAAGSLRRLDLHSSAIGGDLSMLAGASALTWLNLAGTRVSDHDLADLALLPLQWLSLADTGAGDQGVAQLLAMPLLELNLSNTRAGDGSWPVLAQLPLHKLDLSSTKVTCSNLPDGA